MIRRDFDVRKTEGDFLRNYSLHDIAENEGNKVVRSLGYELYQFGEDRRYERVWEAGKDKPDKIVTKKNDIKKICLLDWKGKKYSKKYMMNERAFNSYMRISKSMDLPVVVCMARINQSIIIDFVYFILSDDIIIDREKAWDDNIVVVLSNDRALDFYSTIGNFLSGGATSVPVKTTINREEREKEIDKEIEEFRNQLKQKAEIKMI